MSITHKDIHYSRLRTAPDFDKACVEARADCASPASVGLQTDLWQVQLRIKLMAAMHHWIHIDALAATTEAHLRARVKELLLTGSSIYYDFIVDKCLDRIDELTAQGQCPHHIKNLRAAVCYLAYALKSGSNQSGACNTYMLRFEQYVPPTEVTCLCCDHTWPYAEFRGVRIHPNRMTIAEAGTRWLCTTCGDDEYYFSPQQRCYLSRDEELVEVEGVDGMVSLSYARSNYYMEEDEDSGEETWYREQGERHRLCNYSANPFNYNAWDERNSSNALVFGVELEMEPTNGYSQQQLISLLGGSCKPGNNYILKSDGSLTNGVELVTMPFTLEQHKENKVIKWEKLLTAVNRGAAKSGENTTHCGMHVHINKAALSALTIGKMLVFLNSDTMSPLITTIAQRSSSGYCKRSQKKLTDGARQGLDRYDIMNVSVSHPTCEVRMFRGNLRPERVFKNIEFCHALVQYSRQTSLQDLTDWGNFTRWLVSKRGQYPYLVQFLINKQAVGFRQLAREANEHFTPALIQEV